MVYKKKFNDKRINERMSLTSRILLLDYDGEIKNISADGVYFEIITKKTEAFFPGTILPDQINVVITTPGLAGKGIKIKGSGFVVRNEIKGVTRLGSRLGVALKFDGKLNIVIDGP